MNQPMLAATIATIVPARNALTMYGYASVLRTSSTTFHVSRTLASTSNPAPLVGNMTVAVMEIGVIGRGLGMTDDDESPIRRLHGSEGRGCRAARRAAGATDGARAPAR